MGRHNVPEVLPPPKDKPRYRFVLAISAIFLLAFASMAVVAAIFPEKAPQAEASPGDPNAGNPFPVISTGPTASPGTDAVAGAGSGAGAGAGAGAGSGATSAAPNRPGNSAPTTPPPVGKPTSGGVTGAFTVKTEWADGFIGAVNLSNATSSGQSWQIQLVFADNVGVLQSRWIAGGPGEMTVTRTGQTVTFTGQQVLPSGAKIEVAFQFGKAAGTSAPRTCSINGQACGA